MTKHIDNPKELIIQSAKDLAVKEGIKSLNIRSVANKCNISIGTIYYYFPSKGDIVTEVVENFWMGFFKEIMDLENDNDDFFLRFKDVYDKLNLYLENFKENWLKQLSMLDAEEKAVGRKKEQEYFKKIYDIIIELINKDQNIDKDIWTETFTKEKTSKMIFDNILLMLKNKEDNIDYFIEVLKKIMTK